MSTSPSDLRDEWPSPIKRDPGGLWCAFDSMPDNRNITEQLKILKQENRQPTARFYMELPDGEEWIIDFTRATLQDRVNRRHIHGLDCAAERSALTILQLIPN